MLHYLNVNYYDYKTNVKRNQEKYRQVIYEERLSHHLKLTGQILPPPKICP